jgi:hypothetical protein
MRAPARRPIDTALELALRGHWGKCRPRSCSLELSPDLSVEDWIGIGRVLGTIERAAPWWIGDWWQHAEHRYGERKAIAEAVGWSGPAYQTCMNLGWVCGRFETSRRREVLSFGHHGEVAGLHPQEADVLLDFAEEPLRGGGGARSIVEMRAERWRRHHANEAERQQLVAAEQARALRLASRVKVVHAAAPETLRAVYVIEDGEASPSGNVTRLMTPDERAIEMILDAVAQAERTLLLSQGLRGKLRTVRQLLES